MHPHTSLSFWEHVGVPKLAEFVVGDCAMIFWLKGDETMLIERFRKQRFVPWRDAAEKVILASSLHDLTIDVIITTERLCGSGFERLASDPTKLIEGRASYHDIVMGKNRILLFLEDLDLVEKKNWKRFSDLLATKGISECCVAQLLFDYYHIGASS